MIENIILSTFIFLLFLIFMYSLAQFHLLLNYLRKPKNENNLPELDFSNPEEVPFVTIQLPVFNEKKVMERLLRNIAEIDYPKNKIEFQVLDDSTDDSLEKTAALISELQQRGLNFLHLKRKSRNGFKAGALREGLKTVKGEFIAIFDSDFLPKQDWLRKTIPHFKDQDIGAVQTRWGHLNRNYSLLTKLQAFVLDFHFLLEQNGRNHGRHFINFNGTAGIWRKKCILNAGNWQADTLTEDLDLSYRAQMKNWKIKYLSEIETPAELPVTLSAAKSQQFRWNKGAAENFQKNYIKLIRNRSISLGTKFHSFFHLLNSSLFFIILLLAILSFPVLIITAEGEFPVFWMLAFIFGFATLLFLISYGIIFSRIKEHQKTSFLGKLTLFFSFFAVAMGFSVHNSIAVLEGHFGKKSEFIRTPKFNLPPKEKFSEKIPVKLNLSFLLEISLFFYFISAVIYAMVSENLIMILFHLMLCFGFGFVVVKSLNIDFNFFQTKVWQRFKF